MADIVLEVFPKIQAEFRKRYRRDWKIKRLLKKLKSGQATYEEANAYAIRVGELRVAAYRKFLTVDVLPDGRMYYNIGKRIIDPTLTQNYDLASTYSVVTQKALNDKANLYIKPIKAEKNQSRIDGIINRLSVAEDFNKIKWILNDPIIGFTQSVVDDTLKQNIEFHYEAGLKPTIHRHSVGGCCDWCEALAGDYEYPNVPKNIYARHKYCRCINEYDPGDGAKEDVWKGSRKIQKELNYAEKRKQRIAYDKAKAREDANKKRYRAEALKM